MVKELDSKEIGFRIKTFRLRKNIHQMGLAKMIGISQTHMSNIERGRAGVTIEILVKMSNIFQCRIDDMVFGENNSQMRDHNMDEFFEAYQIYLKIKSMN